MSKIIAVIQARMLSQRLRGKTLMSINGKPLMYRVIENAQQLSFVDHIIVATTSLEADRPIVSAAESLGVEVMTGSSLNVLNRFITATQNYGSDDVIMRLTSDNPILVPSVANALMDKLGTHDYLAVDGLSHICPEFVRVGALRSLAAMTKDPRDFEHVTHFFRRPEGAATFNTELVPSNFQGLRPEFDSFLTVDTQSELTRMEGLLKLTPTANNLSVLYNSLETVLNTEDRPAVSLNGALVSEFSPTFVIAEIGQNHNGSVDLAKQLIDMSKRCGANAVKFQKRDIPSELTKEAFDRAYNSPNSFGATYGEHRMFLELSEEQHLELKEYANAIGITYFCTPCDIPSVELLERIGCPFYKVASRDLTNIPLLSRLAETQKPIIISTGMASIEDIDNALASLDLPKERLIIMQCTSEYPCALDNVNLRAMKTLRKKYGYNVGLSDHTSGVIVSAAASALGASVIEKHVTLDRSMKGTDQPGSLEEPGLKKLVDYIRAIQLAQGSEEKRVNPATEVAKIKLARSLTTAHPLPKGTTVTEGHLCLKSPGDGLKWVERDKIIGLKTTTDIDKDVTIRLQHFE